MLLVPSHRADDISMVIANVTLRAQEVIRTDRRRLHLLVIIVVHRNLLFQLMLIELLLLLRLSLALLEDTTDHVTLRLVKALTVPAGCYHLGLIGDRVWMLMIDRVDVTADKRSQASLFRVKDTTWS